MPKFQKKPVIIEAYQWFKGEDGVVENHILFPDYAASRKCEHCGNMICLHGWVKTLESGHIVCPGDWIITGVQGEKYPCKPDIFKETYNPVKD
jgi:hypothetical protein